MDKEYSNVNMNFWGILFDPSNDIWIPLTIISFITLCIVFHLFFLLIRKKRVLLSNSEERNPAFKFSLVILLHISFILLNILSLQYFANEQSRMNAINNVLEKYSVTNSDLRLSSEDKKEDKLVYKGTITSKDSEKKIKVTIDFNSENEPFIRPNGELPEPKIRKLIR